MTLRKIISADNPAIQQLIIAVMTAYDCVGEGYSINDPEVADMYLHYDTPGAVYFVLEEEGEIYGGGGIGPLSEGKADTCELKKMYFYPEARGKGLGTKLLKLLLEAARNMGYKHCYLETVERMEKANLLYNKFGFKKLVSQEGCTGHSGCDTFYVLDL